MSTKTTMKYINTDIFKFHLYYDFIKGYAIDITINEFNNTLLIDEKTAIGINEQWSNKNDLIDKIIVLHNINNWNGSGFMSDCLGCHWKDLIKIIKGAEVDSNGELKNVE